MYSNFDEPREKAFAYPHVSKVMKQYGLTYSQALSVFNAVDELRQSLSKEELLRVQGFCFFKSTENRALSDIHDIMAKAMGTYPCEDREAIFRLRRKLKRDVPEQRAEQLSKRFVQEVTELFNLPDEAWQRTGERVRVRRHNLFDKPVRGLDGDVLAWTKDWRKAQWMEAVIRGAGEEAWPVANVGHPLTLSAFVKRQVRLDKERLLGSKTLLKIGDEDDRESLYGIVYGLARLAMCDTYDQAATVVGFFRVSFPVISKVLESVWPQMATEEYLRVTNRLPPKMRPGGDSLNSEAADAMAAAILDLSSDAGARAVLGKGYIDGESVEGRPALISSGAALKMLVGKVKEALPYVPYNGRVAARDKTRTRYNALKQAQHVELEELDRAIAIAASMQSAMHIVAAFDLQGRKRAERRVISRLDALLSGDDLV